MQKVKFISVLTKLVTGIFSKLSLVHCEIKSHLLKTYADISKTIFTYKTWKALVCTVSMWPSDNSQVDPEESSVCYCKNNVTTMSIIISKRKVISTSKPNPDLYSRSGWPR